MTRITLDKATITLLRNLDEPLEFWGESGELLGTFRPAPKKAEPKVEPTHVPEPAASGHEIGVYGYSEDLE